MPPLDKSGLERLALRYVERYATTRARLERYLVRKLRERGWSGAETPDPTNMAARMVELGYVDDEGFARAKAGALTRRGYGPRRVAQALKAAGIAGTDAAEAEREAKSAAWQAALSFARRKRIGPYATQVPDRAGQEKAVAALLRAGHDLATARRLATVPPGEFAELEEH